MLELLTARVRGSIEEYEYYGANPAAVQDSWGEQILARPQKLASTVKIDPIIKRSKELHYVYDFGDDWQLRITLEKVIHNHPDSFAVCIGGKESAPPEDVGGAHGYMDFLDAWHNPAHEEHEYISHNLDKSLTTGSYDLRCL